MTTRSYTDSVSMTESTANPLAQWLNRTFPRNWETVAYIVILVLAIFTRFYILGERTMSHDESLHTKFSWDLYANGIFQHTPLMHGPILFHMTALNYFLFGDNDFTARIYTAVLGVGMVMFPLLFRRWLGRWGALLASIMFLISPLILYYNRYIREDTPSIFATMVMVYCTFMYLNGPIRQRRKAYWLYIFSAAMLWSLATKEVAFMYVAIFGMFLTGYWLVRMGQHYFRWQGRQLMNFLFIAALLGLTGSLGMYVVDSILGLENVITTISTGQTTLESSTLIGWSLAVFGFMGIAVIGTMLWAFRGDMRRLPWREVIILLALAIAALGVSLFVEVRSHVSSGTVQTAVPAEPGAVDLAATGVTTYPIYFYIYVGISAVAIAFILFVRSRGGMKVVWKRFPEFDLLVIMGTLIYPWGVPLIFKLMGASMMDMGSLARTIHAAVPLPVDLTSFYAQVFMTFVGLLPSFAVGITLGLAWNWRRWLISTVVFYLLFIFFFTTVFTNINGIGTGLIGSLGYWLEQQGERRGSQPQYYYLLVILPMYEFLPIIGSVLAMFTGLFMFWRFRRQGLIAHTKRKVEDLLADDSDMLLTEPRPETLRDWVSSPNYLRYVPFLLFVSWWAVVNTIALTLAGEKMPWLGTHMTTPMILLAAWYFGRMIDKVSAQQFWRGGWLHLLLLPVLFVAGAQIVAPFLFSGGVGGLEQVQLARLFQWFGGIVIAGIVIYGIFWVVRRTDWVTLRRMTAVAVFAGLSLLTFRSAWMASFINYDQATEFLVYAHGGPSNKRVTEQLEEWSLKTNDGLAIAFAYDNQISWPGAWYFRDFTDARYLGENPSPRDMEDRDVIIVGERNRASVQVALEDRYFEFDYIRMWWPMQDYFDLNATRVLNALDFNPANTTAAQIRQGIWDIWWARDYTTYGTATGKDFTINRWPVSDRMYVFVRKDLASQVWTLGVGQGTAANPATQQEINLCSANWQPLQPIFSFGSVGTAVGQMNYPRQLALAANGNLIVPEEFNYRLSIFQPDGNSAGVIGQQGRLYEADDPLFGRPNDASTGGYLNRPNAVAIGSSGNIYVADTWNFRVQVFTADGNFIRSWGTRAELGSGAPIEPRDGLWGPRAVAVDAEENVYVADTGNKRVRVYTRDGIWLRDIGSGGNGEGQLDEPSGLLISSDGLLWVADTWNRRISVFNLDGSPAQRFTRQDGTLSNNFRVRAWLEDLGNRPYLAFDPVRQYLYVTDPDAGRVLVYNSNGTCIGSFGQLNRETPGPGEFNSIGGIVVDAVGNVWISDAPTARLMLFSPFTLPPDAAGSVPAAPVGVESTQELLPEVTPEATASG
ncbi:MAG TPA: TIGR03663 family protein [Aggregatilineales bacterium]|nr:TIGR03663 family protein [Aggregatilineales bacterium]